MKFLIAIALTILFAFILGLYLPWWSIAVAAFVAVLLVQLNPLPAFFAGLLGIFFLWIILAGWTNSSNAEILSTRVAQLLGVGSPMVLILLTGMVGGLVGGLAGLTGSFLASRKRVRKV
jgi:hypothetical protein